MMNPTPPKAITWAAQLTPEQLAQISRELGEVPDYARLAALKAARQQSRWATILQNPLAWLMQRFVSTTDTAPSADRMQADREAQPRMTSTTPTNTSQAA